MNRPQRALQALGSGRPGQGLPSSSGDTEGRVSPLLSKTQWMVLSPEW